MKAVRRNLPCLPGNPVPPDVGIGLKGPGCKAVKKIQESRQPDHVGSGIQAAFRYEDNSQASTQQVTDRQKIRDVSHNNGGIKYY